MDNISKELEKFITIKNEELLVLYDEYNKIYFKLELAKLFNNFISGNNCEKLESPFKVYASDVMNKFVNLFDKDEYLKFGNSYVFLLDKQLLVLKLSNYYTQNDINKSINVELKDISNGCNYAYRNGPTYNDILNEYYEDGVTANLIDNNNNIILGPIYASEYMSHKPNDKSIEEIINPITFEYIVSKITDNKNFVKKKTLI